MSKLMVVGLVGIGALAYSQQAEIRRYLSMKRM